MSRYSKQKILKTKQGKRYYRDTKYPDVPVSFNDIYIVTTSGDRYDTLANQYLGDSSLWWMIASANPKYGLGSYYPPIGVQLRIPSNQSQIQVDFNVLNNE
jgi:hypothetical protein